MTDRYAIDDIIEVALTEGLGPGEVMSETAIQQAKRSPTLRALVRKELEAEHG